MTKADPNRRMGRYFIYASWVLGFGLLLALFNGWSEHQDNPNGTVNSTAAGGNAAEVRLRQNRAGHYVAGGRINGEAVSFLLDTGATEVSIPADLARRLGLHAGAAQAAHTANGVVQTYATQVDLVELGSIALRNVRAHINPGMQGNRVLLGMSFLRHLDFNQSGRLLTLRQRP